jgi:hypothetical protein
MIKQDASDTLDEAMHCEQSPMHPHVALTSLHACISHGCREVLEGANELRIMLCKEKFNGTKKGTSVIAACGGCKRHAPG